MPIVRGLGIDSRPGCAHWRTPRDIVAIKFPCCGEFYACHDCHLAVAAHPPAVWPQARWGEGAILCCSCQATMSIAAYRACHSQCPSCGAAFNPGCAAHWPLYFAEPPAA